ncbi:MAG: LytTR family DNA-binding domain-containing protein [Gammaproteobacteria bacterium]
MIQRFPALNDWRLVLISGLIGVTLFAPMAYLLEGLFPLAVSEPDSDWSDRFASTSPFAAVLVELLEMAPSYLVAWLLINREALVRTSRSTPGAPSPAPSDDVVSEARRAFLNRLPPAVGRQVVAISSDLHYLQVTTRQGSAMILGALKEVETAFGEAGMRVHRSHWVLLDAVQRMRKGGSAWQLEMSNGHCVPVSRRKRTEVLDRLGEDFVRHSQETKNV